MNIVLIGYRGTGKSVVARLLGERLGREVLSTDAEIVRRAGQTIAEIVAQHGWEHFRQLESEVCREVGQAEALIIDTGGGAILREENVAALRANGRLFWLTAAVSTIASRIADDTQRPSLTGGKSFIDEIEEVLREREPRYQQAADHVIATDALAVPRVADQIITLLQAPASAE